MPSLQGANNGPKTGSKIRPYAAIRDFTVVPITAQIAALRLGLYGQGAHVAETNVVAPMLGARSPINMSARITFV